MSKPNKRQTAALSKNKKKSVLRAAQVPAPIMMKGSEIGAPRIQVRPSAQQTSRTESKQARIIAMLRAPGGATIETLMRATGWQPHSIRGFLAGVIRKKLALNLVSTAADSGRVYRIANPTPARTEPAA